MTKGALQLVAGGLAREITDPKIIVYNVGPGFVATERMAIELTDFGVDVAGAATPESVGWAVAWLLTHPGEAGPSGTTVKTQDWLLEHLDTPLVP